MLERGDVAYLQYHFLFPESFRLNFDSEMMKRISIHDLKTQSFSRLSILYEQVSELFQFAPYFSLSNDRDDGRLSLEKEDIEVAIRLKRETEFRIDVSPEKEEKVMTDEKLRAMSNDSNILAGMLLGRLGLQNKDITVEFRCDFTREHIFERGFSDHFNQSFLAKLDIKEVLEIDVKSEAIFAGIPCSVRYDLLKGKKKDKVDIRATFKTFTPVAFDSHLNEAIKKANDILGMVGAKQ